MNFQILNARHCKACDVLRDLSGFHAGNYRCKTCRKRDGYGNKPATKRAWRQANAEKIREYGAAYAKEHAAEGRARSAAYYRRNPEKCIARSKAQRARHPTRKYKSEIKLKYGLSPEDYDRMLVSQGGACSICKCAPSPGTVRRQRLHVDHDHATGKVRGLLCINCNRALGLLRDDVDIASNAAMYLAEHARIWLCLAA